MFALHLYCLTLRPPKLVQSVNYAASCTRSVLSIAFLVFPCMFNRHMTNRFPSFNFSRDIRGSLSSRTNLNSSTAFSQNAIETKKYTRFRATADRWVSGLGVGVEAEVLSKTNSSRYGQFRDIAGIRGAINRRHSQAGSGRWNSRNTWTSLIPLDHGRAHV